MFSLRPVFYALLSPMPYFLFSPYSLPYPLAFLCAILSISMPPYLASISYRTIPLLFAILRAISMLCYILSAILCLYLPYAVYFALYPLHHAFYMYFERSDAVPLYFTSTTISSRMHLKHYISATITAILCFPALYLCLHAIALFPCALSHISMLCCCSI